MTYPPDLAEEYRQLEIDLRRSVEAAQARGLSEPLLAKTLLNTSMEVAAHGEPQEFFDHILWVRSEGDQFLREFERRFGDKIDIAALCRGELKAKS